MSTMVDVLVLVLVYIFARRCAASINVCGLALGLSGRVCYWCRCVYVATHGGSWNEMAIGKLHKYVSGLLAFLILHEHMVTKRRSLFWLILVCMLFVLACVHMLK